jgi:hypothetical protein
MTPPLTASPERKVNVDKTIYQQTGAGGRRRRPPRNSARGVFLEHVLELKLELDHPNFELELKLNSDIKQLS